MVEKKKGGGEGWGLCTLCAFVVGELYGIYDVNIFGLPYCVL
jgi:hypothetical protein